MTFSVRYEILANAENPSNKQKQNTSDVVDILNRFYTIKCIELKTCPNFIDKVY